jgi:hypothetical protein
MARDGTGVYSLPAGNPVQTGTAISSSTHNTTLNDIAAALSQSLSKDGQTVPTANLPMGGFKHTGMANGTAADDSAAFGQIATAVNAAVNPIINRIGDAGSSSSRNRIINGNFAINQRGVSGTVTLAAGAYGHDRWKAGASGCTYTFAASGNDTVITITSGSLMQVVEGVNVEGGQYTLNNGGGTAQMRVAINGATTSGAYANGPITTASATANQSITVEFATGTVGKVQLEPGTTASTFERRHYSAELAMCQRYYEVGRSMVNGYMQSSGSNLFAPVCFKATKRASPTITFSNSTVSSIVNGPSSANVGVSGFGFGGTTTGTGSGDASVVADWAAAAEI